jgi:hypothetical protein
MTVRELERRFVEEGCNPNNYCIGPPQCPVTDIYCLDQMDGEWQVFYTERGRDDPPIFTDTDETEACEYYYRQITSFRQDHCVGFFRSEENARALMAKLQAAGLYPHQDAIPYGGWVDPRFRVFVTGKAIFTARELLGLEALTDDKTNA